jgi:hypothetical protein
MTRDEVSRLLAVMRATFPQTKITDPEAMLTGYHLGLRNVPYDDAQEAVAQCIETCTFMPTVAEIRERLPRQPGIDATLYRRFGELHGKPRTPAEDHEYGQLCKKLGVPWVASENPAPRKEALTA